MSVYSDYKCGAMSKEEYDVECRRESARDNAREMQMMYEDACYERCEQCEMFEDGKCAAGENILDCTIVG